MAGTVSMQTAAVSSVTARSTAAMSANGTLVIPGTSGANHSESRASSIASAADVAVVAVLGGHDPRPSRRGPGQLAGDLDRLAAARREEGVAELAGQGLGERTGRPGPHGGRDQPVAHVAQLLQRG